MNEKILEAALKLANKGIPSFPCRVGKGPACPGTFRSATKDENELIELWANHPGSLIGVPTGKITGISVLDIDPKNGGLQWLEEHKHKIGITRIHHTRSGGYHYFFKYVEGLKNSNNKIAPGVDVRNEGGYVIWWPSAGFKVENNNVLIEWPEWLGKH